MPTAREVFARGMDLAAEGRTRDWAGLFAEDGVLEFPFPPPGFTTRVVGRSEVYEHMKHLPELLEVRFSAPLFHDTTDPDLVIAEFTSDNVAVATGREFRQSHLAVVWFRAGEIVRYRDFWNPWVFIETLGGQDALQGQR